jgi:NAD(P)-dependent dehydrogenase (short-subunit alcohol dehydrogenase family)
MTDRWLSLLSVAITGPSSPLSDNLVATFEAGGARVDQVDASLLSQDRHDSTTTFVNTVATDLSDLLTTCETELALLRELGSGSIVNLLPAPPERSTGDVAVDLAASGGAGLTRSLGVRAAPLGIRVNAVALAGPAAAGRAPLGEPSLDHVSGVVAFLASERARWVFAEVLRVDGGAGANHMA